MLNITEAHNFLKQFFNQQSTNLHLPVAGIGTAFTGDEVIWDPCFQRMGEPLNARRSNGGARIREISKVMESDICTSIRQSKENMLVTSL